MAAEDRLLLLQSQALAEEEATKKKREMLTRFLKVHGGREGDRWCASLHTTQPLTVSPHPRTSWLRRSAAAP